MSVWVMTAPLTIAVAFTTDGIAAPNNCGFSGSRSALVLSGAGPASGWFDCWATAAVAVTMASAAAPQPQARRNPFRN